MWRYLAGAVAALLMAMAGMLVFNARARPDPVLPRQPAAAPIQSAGEEAALPDTVPEASPRSREQKRFDRYDKDRDGSITRAEYLAPRRKAYAKLDANGDGVLSFEEWANKTTAKFAAADSDRSGAMSAKEFSTTAAKRSARPRAKCPPTAPVAGTDD